MMNLMKTYAMIDVSLEAFSLDSCEDVVGDGIDTYSQKIIADFSFGLHKNGVTPGVYDETIQSPKTKIAPGTNIIVEIMQLHDSVIKFNPKTS